MCQKDKPELVTWRGLQVLYGWPYSKTHTLRMVKEGRFPSVWKVPGSPRNGHPLWRSDKLDAYFGLNDPPH